jgi:hypothetical protein
VTDPATSRGGRFGVIAAIAAAAFIGILLMYKINHRRNVPVEQTQKKPNPATLEKTAPADIHLDTAKPPTADVAIAVTLTPDSTRGEGETKVLQMNDQVQTVQLQLAVEGGEYNKYRVVLRTREGARVWSAAGLAPRATSENRWVRVNVPRTVLNMTLARDYVVRLLGSTEDGGADDVAEYSFRVQPVLAAGKQ